MASTALAIDSKRAHPDQMKLMMMHDILMLSLRIELTFKNRFATKKSIKIIYIP
jgi:hypothetical protein